MNRSVSGGSGVLIFDEDRASDSPYVERVWRSHSEGAGFFVSIAESRAEIVFARHHGRLSVWLRGPETRPSCAPYPADGEWLGIRFKPGAFLLTRPVRELVDGKVGLRPATEGSFWLNGSTWQVPDFANADTFVEWLERRGWLTADPAVPAVLNGDPAGASRRTLQRHFRQVTGITRSTIRQIERARYAALLLREGGAICDAVHRAGYFDQSHLTRSMRHFIGRTPAQLLDRNRSDQLSFLYKTTPRLWA